MNPFADVGRRRVRAYAAHSGQTEEAYLRQLGEVWTPEVGGSAQVELVRAFRRPGLLGTYSPEPDCRRCHEYRRGRLPRRATSETSTLVTNFKEQMPHGGEWRLHAKAHGITQDEFGDGRQRARERMHGLPRRRLGRAVGIRGHTSERADGDHVSGH